MSSYLVNGSPLDRLLQIQSDLNEMFIEDGVEALTFPEASGALVGTITAGHGLVMNASGVISISGTLNVDLSGNASTASKLVTPTTIAGKIFDGSQPISLASSDLSDFTGLANKTYVDNQIAALVDSPTNIILEYLATNGDGSTLNGARGSYTTPNNNQSVTTISAYGPPWDVVLNNRYKWPGATLTLSGYQDGSYLPPIGTTQVILKLNGHIRQTSGTADDVYFFLNFDGTEVNLGAVRTRTPSPTTFNISFLIRISSDFDQEDISKGHLQAWTSPRALQIQYRPYNQTVIANGPSSTYYVAPLFEIIAM